MPKLPAFCPPSSKATRKLPRQLLPLVYNELRRLASQRLAQENPGQTLQATALVHEAYLRLVGDEGDQRWDNRGHFFAAAAEAMRRILVDQARRKQADKRGGNGRRVPMDAADVGFTSAPDELLDIDEALTRLAAEDPQAARLDPAPLLRRIIDRGRRRGDRYRALHRLRTLVVRPGPPQNATGSTVNRQRDRILFFFSVFRTNQVPNPHCRCRTERDVFHASRPAKSSRVIPSRRRQAAAGRVGRLRRRSLRRADPTSNSSWGTCSRFIAKPAVSWTGL